MITCAGTYFDLADPGRYPVDARTIATALSRIQRFNGHVTDWSVLEHSYLVADICRAHARRLGWFDGPTARVVLLGLLHDAHEGYVGDFMTPLKRALSPAARREIETMCSRVQTAIYVGLSVLPPNDAEMALVRTADLMALYLEREREWPEDVGASDWGCFDRIEPLLPRRDEYASAHAIRARARVAHFVEDVSNLRGRA